MSIPENYGGGQRPDAILIAGPTASGKSGLALELAKRWDGEIINTDSMQIYPVLNVLTARPPVEDLDQAPHHLYAIAPLDQPWSVERWRLLAEAKIVDVRERGHVPIFVGGTGLYFKALDEGLSRVPDIPEQIRTNIRNRLLKEGSEALHNELQERDPDGAEKLKPGDSHRISRALEVVVATGKPLGEHQKTQSSSPLTKGMNCQRIVLSPSRSLLHERINDRSRFMLNNGSIEEVRELMDLKLPSEATVLRAIGVPQIVEWLAGTINETVLLEKLQAATRQYAKRQSTWFRGQFGKNWHFYKDMSELL